MKPSAATLADLAERWGFDARQLEIVCHLLDVLDAIGADRTLSSRLLLKGGTALNLMSSEPPRLSVDIDCNDIGSPERERMLAERPAVLAAVESIGRRLGYRIQRSAEGHAGQMLFFRASSALGGAITMKVDLNFLFRVPLGAPRAVQLWDPTERRAVSVRVVSSEELVAGKLIALLDRTAARDLFDVARLASGLLPGLDLEKLRPVFVALSSILPLPVSRYGIDRLDRVTEKDVEHQLLPLLRVQGTSTASVLREAARRFIKPLLDLSGHERAFVDAIEHGELLPELICPSDPGLAIAISKHPAILWKVQNAAARDK